MKRGVEQLLPEFSLVYGRCLSDRLKHIGPLSTGGEEDAPGGDHQGVSHHACSHTTRLEECKSVEDAGDAADDCESPVGERAKCQMREPEQDGCEY